MDRFSKSPSFFISVVKMLIRPRSVMSFVGYDYKKEKNTGMEEYVLSGNMDDDSGSEEE